MKEVVEEVVVNKMVTERVMKTMFVGECPVCGAEQKNENSNAVDIMCNGCDRHKDFMFKRNKWTEEMNKAVFVDIAYDSYHPYAFVFKRPDASLFYVYINEDIDAIENPMNPEILEEDVKMNKIRDNYWNTQPKQVDPLEDFYKEKGLI